jgi:DNA-binding MarR family transcriptional regulator
MAMDHVDEILGQWARERPELDASAMEVGGRISRAARYFEAGWARTFVVFGLNRGEFDVLASLRRAGRPYALTPSELAGALLLSGSAMTNRMDRLELAGLVRRQPDPTDRRGVLVYLTERGLSQIDEVIEIHIARERDRLRDLDPDRRDRLADLLRELLVMFERRDGAGRKPALREEVKDAHRATELAGRED